MASDAKRRGAARMLVLAGAASLALALTTLALARALDAAGIPEPYIDFDGMALQLEVVERLRARDPAASERRIAFLGDSTAMNAANGALGLDHQIEPALAALARDEVPHRVFSFASAGFTQFTQYFLSHRVAEAGPDAVILAFNLASFSNQWRNADRPKLAAWLPVSRLTEAFALPLHWIGLSVDELLLYSTTVSIGGFEAWQRLTLLQARCVRAWEALAIELQARSGAPDGLAYQRLLFYQRRQAQYLPGPPERERASLVHSRLDAVLAGVAPDHPVLRVLDATLTVFRERGIPVLVYVAPLNIEYFETIGLGDREGLRRGVESVRRVVRAGGATLIDLHDLLPDAAFADGGGHLVANETLVAPRIAADRIAGALLQAQGAR